MRALEDTALAFSRACREAGVSYAYMGAMAVIAWGQPRTTSDVDALLRIERAQIPAFVSLLQKEGLRVAPGDFESAFDEGGHVTVFDAASHFHAYVKLAKKAAELDEIEQAAEVPFKNESLRVVGPEDTIAFKLVFGSPQDLQDARSILARQGAKLDSGRLTSLCLRLGVAEGLRRLEREVAEAAAEEGRREG